MARQRFPTAVRALLGAFFVSAIGRGLTMPFLLIYLHQVRGISLGVAGVLIGAVGILAVPVGPITGTLVDRFSPRFVALGSLVLQAAGTASLVLIRSPVSAIVPCVIFGVASGASWPAWNALLAVLVQEEEHRPRVFALNFQLLNLGLGIGSVVGGFAVAVGDPGSFVRVFLADAAGTLVVVGALAVLPAAAFARAGHHGAIGEGAGGSGSPGTEGRSGYRAVFADRRFRWYLIAGTLLAAGGYGSLTAAYVGYATTVIHVSSRTIAWAFAANTFIIVATQPIGLRLVRRMRRTTALSVTAVFWGVSWAILGLGALVPRSAAGDAVTIVMFAVFSLGEVLLSPVSGPLVNDLAPPALLGRYNAAASTTYSAAGVVSPPIAGALLGAGFGTELLGLLVACCAGTVWACRRLRRVLTPADDQAPGWREVASGDVPSPEDAAA